MGDAFLAVDLEPGEHQVSLTYTPPGFVPGMAVSVACIGVYVLICACSPLIRRKREEWANRKIGEIPADEEMNDL